jgi:hypothetical protein
MVSRHCKSVLCVGLLVVGMIGCTGSDDIGPVQQVTGKVTIDGTPLAGGTVTFHPDTKKGNKTKAGVSGVVKNGEYTLSSASITTTKPGAPPGSYKVTISTQGSTMNMTGKGSAPVKDQKGDPGKPAPTGPGQGGGQQKGDTPIAAKYTDPSSTPLEIEVKSGGNYDLTAESK